LEVIPAYPAMAHIIRIDIIYALYLLGIIMRMVWGEFGFVFVWIHPWIIFPHGTAFRFIVIPVTFYLMEYIAAEIDTPHGPNNNKCPNSRIHFSMGELQVPYPPHICYNKRQNNVKGVFVHMVYYE
jgi:hypothetical protein